MTDHRRLCVVLATILPLFAMAGCEALSQPFPDKQFFSVDPGEPVAPAATPSSVVVRVRQLRVSEPYDGRTFVYKTGPSKFQTDYYNGLVASPDSLLTGAMIQWLTESRLYRAVLDSSGDGESQYILDGVVSELYADYTDEGSAKAVITARFFLLDDRSINTIITFQKTYHKEAILEDKKPESLSAGFGEAYRQVLTELTADLGKVQVSQSEKTAGK